ncbi:MAG: IPT/TIG domain-containing protein [Pseudomonadota bacterium]
MKNRIFASFVLLLSCCSNSRFVRVVGVRDVASAGGAPSISSIRDIGTGALPRLGEFAIDRSDGRTEIGELLLIRGSNFGKQPTVTIGGRPGEVIAHAKGGAIIVRVPTEIDPGLIELTVANENGSRSKKHLVRRLGVAISGQELLLFEVGVDGLAKDLEQRIPLVGANSLAISADGSVAYVAGTKTNEVIFWVVDLTSKNEGRIVSERKMPGKRVIALATAKKAPLGAVLTDTHLVYFSTERMLRPEFYRAHPLAIELQKQMPIGVGLSGNGRALAILLAEQNRIAFFDSSNPSVFSQPQMVDVLPDTRLPVVQDLSFSADDGSLWVASGDTPHSIVGGYQNAQIISLKMVEKNGQQKLEVSTRWTLEGVGSPQALVVGPGQPRPSGTSVRLEESDSSVYLGSVSSDLLKKGFAGSSAKDLGGKVFRSTLVQPNQPIVAGEWLVKSLDVVGETRILLALLCKKSGGRWKKTVLSKRAWDPEVAPRFLVLGSCSPEELEPPFSFGAVKAQP